MSPTFVTYQNYSGYKVAGLRAFSPADVADSHLERAVWLASQVEGGGTWGTVQGYDGCGISGGLLHNVGLYRTGEQGDFWKLIDAINLDVQASARGALPELEAIKAELARLRWEVRGGLVRFQNSGVVVNGHVLQTELSGPGGNPQTLIDRARAAAWCARFSALLENQRTYSVQKRFAANWMYRSQTTVEARAYALALGRPPRDEEIISLPMHVLGEPFDLAMCCLHSHSVNAPAIALTKLTDTLAHCTPADFPQRIIRALATSNYGKWHDTKDGANRYDRTRLACARSGFWNPGTISALLPTNF
jgi:hypothetical protein